MKASTIHEVKKELKNLDPEQLLEICLRMAKFKKENKELLTYLLFDASDEQEYIRNLKLEIDEQFTLINRGNLYYTKKGLRKILRNITKFNRYSGIKATEIEVLLYFCTKIKASNIPIATSAALINLYNAQIKKIKKTMSYLHEDMQFDYQQELEELE